MCVCTQVRTNSNYFVKTLNNSSLNSLNYKKRFFQVDFSVPKNILHKCHTSTSAFPQRTWRYSEVKKLIGGILQYYIGLCFKLKLLMPEKMISHHPQIFLGLCNLKGFIPCLSFFADDRTLQRKTTKSPVDQWNERKIFLIKKNKHWHAQGKGWLWRKVQVLKNYHQLNAVKKIDWPAQF